jgi:hypothetical protein
VSSIVNNILGSLTGQTTQVILLTFVATLLTYTHALASKWTQWP